jgi:hypothetical protein
MKLVNDEGVRVPVTVPMCLRKVRVIWCKPGMVMLDHFRIVGGPQQGRECTAEKGYAPENDKCDGQPRRRPEPSCQRVGD